MHFVDFGRALAGQQWEKGGRVVWERGTGCTTTTKWRGSEPTCKPPPDSIKQKSHPLQEGKKLSRCRDRWISRLLRHNRNPYPISLNLNPPLPPHHRLLRQFFLSKKSQFIRKYVFETHGHEAPVPLATPEKSVQLDLFWGRRGLRGGGARDVCIVVVFPHQSSFPSAEGIFRVRSIRG